MYISGNICAPTELAIFRILENYVYSRRGGGKKGKYRNRYQMARGRLLFNRLHVACTSVDSAIVRFGVATTAALRPRGELIVIEHRSTIGNPSVGERMKERNGKEGARATSS